MGGSIEDYTGSAEDPLYDVTRAADRIRAAAEAARGLGFPFTLTARAENFFRGRPDLADVIRRLQAYQEAGADVLYAPSLQTRDQIATLLREVDRPVNVLVGRSLGLSVAELSALGVRRISLGGMLSAVAYGALLHAAREILDAGTFGFAGELDRAKDLRALLDSRTT